jgi:hypothetical protein
VIPKVFETTPIIRPHNSVMQHEGPFHCQQLGRVF